MSKCEKCGREGCPNIDTYSCVRIQRDALQARVAALEAQLKTARERVEKARYTVSYSGVSPREAVNRAVLMLLADALAALRKEPK